MADTDVTLYGATGFVGALTARHLADAAPPGLRVALAGRSLPRLEALRRGLGEQAAHWTLVTAAADDEAQLAAMVGSTRVVASTVGPYARWGMPLVRACASAGTAYCDLTGELLFVRDSIEACHDLAESSGARIVHACGFESIPSDLGVFLTAEQARHDGQGQLTRAQLAVESLRGGLSGGTVDSARNVVLTAQADPAARRALGDPDLLSVVGVPHPSSTTTRGEWHPRSSPLGRLPVRRNSVTGHWVGPFVMAAFNTRVVRRSNALLAGRYGSGFRYGEVVDFGAGLTSPFKALATTAALAGVSAAFGWGPARAVIDRVLPKPGEGPSAQERQAGRFRLVIRARTTTGAAYRTVVAADKDPGYGATAVMFGESALCLALDGERLPDRAGVLTPATAMGMPLVTRLREHGMTFDCRRDPDAAT